MNTSIRYTRLRRTVLAVCLAAALGSGSAMAGAHNDHSGNAHRMQSAPSWIQSVSPPADRAARRQGWKTRASRVTGARDHTPSDTLVVTSCADSGPGSLREAAANANDYDTIDLSGLNCPGTTISLTSGAVDLAVPHLYLLGPGADALTIDGGNMDRVLSNFNYPGMVYISGLTIANGRTNGPGGCIVTYDTAVLVSSTISGCHVESDGNSSTPYYVGGGIAAAGAVILQDSIVTGNDVSAGPGQTGYGGGAYGRFIVDLEGSRIESNGVTSLDGAAFGGGLVAWSEIYLLGQTRIAYNTATSISGTARGGGAQSFYGSISMNQATITGNVASSTDYTAYGGGLGVLAGSSYGPVVTAAQSTISGNVAQSDTHWAYGGGIQGGVYYSSESSDVVLEDSTISGNTASTNCNSCFIMGGGVAAFGNIVSYYSTISDNLAINTNSESSYVDVLGGGLATGYFSASYNNAIVLASSTVSGNRATAVNGYSMGGGVFANDYTAVYAANSTVAFNEADMGGGGIYFSEDSTFDSTIIANNSAPQGADLGTWSSPVVSGDHNLVMEADPAVNLPPDTLTLDPMLLRLHGNGGPNATHALGWCSPAIDAGSNPWGFVHDQRGTPFSRSWAAAQDIGAFELQPDADHIFGNDFEFDICSPI